jgi:hypothetical protein
MNAGQYEVARRKFVDYLHLAVLAGGTTPQDPPITGGYPPPRTPPSLPSAMATHSVKPSRPADGV